MKLRADRWRQNPAKDAERSAQLAPYLAALEKLSSCSASQRSSFRWLIEEFRVSLFAQELGTAEPVSAAKLDRTLAALTGKTPSVLTAAKETAPPKPILTTRVPEQKPAAVKSLGALDKLFPR
jgi:ATP-dependent helicase HrpA